MKKINENVVIEQWYPTFIGYCDYSNHKKIEKSLIKECFLIQKNIKSGGKNWISNKTYNTLDTYNILENKKFYQLNNWIFNKILEYANNLKYKDKYKCSEGWFNIYKKYDYQEYHDHPISTFSAVYFLKSDQEKSSKIYFKFNNTTNPMEPASDPSFKLSYKTVFYNPIPGRLLIFPSTLKHCVERHEYSEKRISLAYNFIKTI
jgi:uncharacterized protein (TIGR02466 family)